VQEELLEGVTNVASKGKFRPPVIKAGADQQSIEKIVKLYTQEMSPGLVDITKLPHEEHHVDIVLELDNKASLVSNIDMYHRTKPICAQTKLRCSIANSHFITEAPQPTAEIPDTK